MMLLNLSKQHENMKSMTRTQLLYVKCKILEIKKKYCLRLFYTFKVTAVLLGK